MKRKFWMWIHDWAENLWHYAYRKAYPQKPEEPFSYQYNIVYLNGVGGPIKTYNGTEFRTVTKYDS